MQPQGLATGGVARPGAIFAAALGTLARARPIDVQLDGRPMRVVNLSLQKSRFVAGTLTYDTPVAPDDGQFAVNLAGNLTRFDTIRAFAGLMRGRFLGRDGCRAWHAHSLTLDAPAPTALEVDGEVVYTSRARFDVLERALHHAGRFAALEQVELWYAHCDGERHDLTDVFSLRRLWNEYIDLPGLHLTFDQVRRLLAVDTAMCTLVLDSLVELGFLTRAADGRYGRSTERHRALAPLRMKKLGVDIAQR